MTDREFELLDELYFVTSYADLKAQLGWENNALCSELTSLFHKGWVRVFASPDDPADFTEVTDQVLMNAYLLASKAGLKAHNS